MNQLKTSLKVFFAFTLLVGVIYPVLITIIAQIIFPYQANGSLIKINNKIVGSEHLGQNFDRPDYFNSRPSAVDYNAQGSGGSNLGPSNKKFIDTLAEKVEKIRVDNNLKKTSRIPADMVLASSSGLDPHISRENALLQIERISQKRNITKNKLKKLIDKNTDPDFIALWGQSGVNVLKLNIALDKIKKDENKE